MEKVKAFFKKVYDLFIASNRWMHMIAGGIIYIFMVAATAIWNPYDPDALQAIFVGTLATLIPMVAVEYKDMAHEGDFDWKDIIAGMTPPVLIDILCVIMMICK